MRVEVEVKWNDGIIITTKIIITYYPIIKFPHNNNYLFNVYQKK